MVRGFLLTLLALASAACTYGSAVDLAPFEERSAFSQITPGTYCPVENGQVATAGDACATIAWDRARRLAVVEEVDAEGAVEAPGDNTAAFRRLRPGLLLAQTRAGDPGDETPFDIILVLATRDAIAPLDLLPDAAFLELAHRHPGVTVRAQDGQREILAGPRSDIHAFLVDAAALTLAFYAEDGDKPQVSVRDPGTRAGHAPTASQRRAMAAIDRIAAGLARDAPKGIARPEPASGDAAQR